MKFITRVLICLCVPVLLAFGCDDSDNDTNEDTPSYAPQPGDENLRRSGIYIDAVELLTLESQPPQFKLNMRGNLPTPCHKLRIVVSEPNAMNKILVDAYSLVNPEDACIQMLEPFTEQVTIPTPPPGRYTIVVNGEFEKTLEY